MSLNSDVVSMYWSFAGRIVAISSCDFCDAVRCLRMVRENLGHRSRLLLFLRLDLFKEVYKLVGIIAGFVHVLDAQIIGLSLKAAGEFEERHRQADAGRFTRRQANAAANKDQRKAGVIGELVRV